MTALECTGGVLTARVTLDGLPNRMTRCRHVLEWMLRGVRARLTQIVSGTETYQMWVSEFLNTYLYRGIQLRDASASRSQAGVMQSEEENDKRCRFYAPCKLSGTYASKYIRTAIDIERHCH